MLPGQKQEAEALRVAITRGFAAVADAVAWADRVIVADPRPDWALLDISLAGRGSPADMITLLRDVPGEVDHESVMRDVLARMLRALDADAARAERIANSLYWMKSDGDLPDEPFGWEPYTIADVFALARVGTYGSRDEAVRELRRYLHAHAASEPQVPEDAR
ncbi:hypothetical protein SAMN05216486_10259 [bacterium JGI 053]|nr:hypothetical protein SAMN05216486_10259 [bacterium JGI 053]